MMKTVRHNRKELKHAENREKRYFMNKPVKPVKVNNFPFMDNQERFENVCLGYSIQAERLMNIVQQNTTGTITKDWVPPEISEAHQKFCLLSAVIKTIYQQITEDHCRS